MKDMKTNEANRVKSDNQIPLSRYDIFGEIIGNMSGKNCYVNVDYNNQLLTTYTDDDSFSDKDKKAICEKNCSGNNKNTVGLNGHGIKLALNKILPNDENELAIIYSIKDKMKCYIGHFTYSDWIPFNADEIDKFSNKISGSYFHIPLSFEMAFDFQDNEDNLKKFCKKFFNKKIHDKLTNFYWNDELQEQTEICVVDENYVEIHYELGYDTQKNPDDLSPDNKLPLIMHINSIKGKHIFLNDIAKYFVINKDTKKFSQLKINKQIKYCFKKVESGFLRLNILNNNDLVDSFPIKWVDGCLVYLKDRNININAVTKNLGGKTIDGNFGDQIYGGKPRFENYINKDSKQYSIPPDKSNIRPTLKGESVLNVIKIIGTEMKKSIYGDTENRNIKDSLKEEIWNRAFPDKFYGNCFCCDKRIQVNFNKNNNQSLEFGHRIPFSECKENKWDNIFPICKGCNHEMKDENMDTWMISKYPTRIEIYNRTVSKYLNSEFPIK